jgi:hypothetical protein
MQLSNQGGVQSALMAHHGVLAKGEPLEGRAGLFAAYYGGRYDADPLVSELGTRFVSLDRCVKAPHVPRLNADQRQARFGDGAPILT